MGRKLALIYGGQSGEHEVSVLSAASVKAALDRSKFEVLPIGITRDGQWIPGLSPQSLVQSKDLQVKPISEQGAENDYSLVSNPAGVLLGRLKEEVDLVFPYFMVQWAKTAVFKACWSWPGFRISVEES